MNFLPKVMNDALVNALGLVAGTIVAVAILPQIYRVHKRESGTDLSVTRQVVTATGATMQIIYLVYFGMWAVAVPLGCQLVFLFYLSCLRAYFERFGRKREAAAQIVENDPDTEASDDRTPSASQQRDPYAHDALGNGLVAVSQEPQ